MHDDVVISVKNMKKRFKIYADKGSSLKEKIIFSKRNEHENKWVLNGISFQIKRGEAVGLIGKNGCGKSTTLKLLTRIMYPTSGKIEIEGRVSSLIELGAGFHPDMSGRENIYTNASIFGLSRKEIDARIEDIIRFSELEEFIDNPVRTYSSGMYMRLAFSVAINVEADILLIDEILAVGDVNFQKKCFEKLKQIKRNGTTIVIVSHSLGQIEEICDKTIWLEDGKIRMEDSPQKVHEEYLFQMEEERMDRINEEYEEMKLTHEEPQEVQETKIEETGEMRISFAGGMALRRGIGEIQYQDILISNLDKKPSKVFGTGDDIYIHVKIKSTKAERDHIALVIKIVNTDGVLCFVTNTDIECEERFDIDEDLNVVLVLKNIPLLKGQYVINMDIVDSEGVVQDMLCEMADFYIEEKKRYEGITKINTLWRVE